MKNIPRALYKSVTAMFSSFIAMTKLKGMKEVYFYQFILAFVGFTIQVFFPLLIIYRGFSEGTVSEVSFYATLVLLWFKPHLGKLIDRVSYSSVLAVLLIASGSFLLLANIVTDLGLIIILYTILFGCVITA